MKVRIARFHNIFGPEGTYDGGKEKVPAALARKVARAINGDHIEVWGDGQQTRSFLYVQDCVEAVFSLMQSDFIGPVNIGSGELISINDLANILMKLAGKTLSINHIEGPQGVRDRNSDNRLIGEKLGWEPKFSLEQGLELTYRWIQSQIDHSPDLDISKSA